MMPALAPRISSPNTMSMPQDHGHSEHMLREHYMPPPQPDPIDTSMQQQQGPSSPNDPNNDNVTGSAESDGGDGPDGRKGYGKRELSTSKRAAQNRAAQRAFRQRKEGYIKKLEEQVRDYQILSENFKNVQTENYQLRDYIINLQSRLLESQGEVPPPPSNVDGLSPTRAGQPPQSGTLPRLSEMGAVGSQQEPPPHLDTVSRSSYPDPMYTAEAPSAKRMRTSSSAEMTPSQQALQGASILAGGSPNGPR